MSAPLSTLVLIALSPLVTGDLPLVDPTRPSALLLAEGRLRAAGIPIVAISQPGAPWAAVQLHVRTGARERTAPEAKSTWALAVTLAEGRLAGPRDISARDDVALAGGETRVAMDLDGLVVADALPAADLDVALRAMEKRLARRRKLVVPASPAPRLEEAPREIPLAARQLLAAGHPASFSLDDEAGLAPEATLALAERVLRRDDVVLVVVGPDTPEKLLARAERAIRTPLPAGRGAPMPLEPLTGTRVVDGAEIATRGAIDGAPVTALYVPIPHEPVASSSDRAAALRERAALALVAELAGVTFDERAAFVVVSAIVRGARVASTDGERDQATHLAMSPIAALAARPIDDETLAAARARVRTSTLRALTSPEGAALVVGRAALHDGAASTLDGRLAAIDAATADDVVAAAARVLAAGRVVARGTEVSSWR